MGLRFGGNKYLFFFRLYFVLARACLCTIKLAMLQWISIQRCQKRNTSSLWIYLKIVEKSILRVATTGHGERDLILRCKQHVKLEVLNSDANVIDAYTESERKLFSASFVYVDKDKSAPKLLWNHLIVMNGDRDGLWFVIRDFNNLINNEEKARDPTHLERSFLDLRTFFSEVQLQHSGHPLSSKGQRGDHFVRCGLDRAVANTSELIIILLLNFTTCFVKGLTISGLS